MHAVPNVGVDDLDAYPLRDLLRFLTCGSVDDGKSTLIGRLLHDTQMVKCRMRSLGCSPCTGAIRSDADTVPKIIEELISVRRSERENRVIDYDQDGSMEMKKREGYF